MPDPKLKTAMEEIKTVLTKYDIAGIVVLSSETHMEYLNHVTPSWSCLRLTEIADGTEIRIRAKRDDFASREAHKKCLQDTIGMVVGFADAQTHCAEQMGKLAAMIGEHVPFDHRTTHEE